MEMQKEIKESIDKLEIFVLCPGLSENEIVISFDEKEGMLEVTGIPKQSTMSDIIDIEISGKCIIPPKYRSDKINLEINNGIMIITFKLNDNIKILKAN